MGSVRDSLESQVLPRSGRTLAGLGAWLVLALVALLAACGGSVGITDGPGSHHPSGWLAAHPAPALARVDACMACHEMNVLKVGSSIPNCMPTYFSRTTTQEKGVFNVGVGLRAPLAKKLSFMGEFYPRPAKIAKTNPQGYAAGLSYKTFKHRFTVIGTNSPGTTANQVLSGDYGGGPRPSSRWSVGFNLVRTF